MFDNGPPIGFRARAGESIQLVVPFGATFVAWSDANDVQSWLGKADPPLSADEPSGSMSMHSRRSAAAATASP